MDSSVESESCSQSKSSSEYRSLNDFVFYTGILENSSSETKIFFDIRKDLLTTRQIYVSQNRNVLHFSDINLFYYIRKDNVFLSVLRL